MKSLSIRTKFIIAFLVLSLLAIALVGVFRSCVSIQQFQSLVLGRYKEDYTSIVVRYYETYGTLLRIKFLFCPSPFTGQTELEGLVRTGFMQRGQRIDPVCFRSFSASGEGYPPDPGPERNPIQLHRRLPCSGTMPLSPSMALAAF